MQYRPTEKKRSKSIICSVARKPKIVLRSTAYSRTSRSDSLPDAGQTEEAGRESETEVEPCVTRSATCGLPTISICLDAVKKNSSSSLTELRKTVANYGMEISSDKSKILVNSSKPRPSTNILDEWKNAGRTRSVQIPGIHTIQRRNINKGSKDQTGASTLSHDKAANTIKKQRHQFFLHIFRSCQYCSIDVRAGR